MKSTLTFLLALVFAVLLRAQPTNDNCVNAIALADVTDFCSGSNVYSSIGATGTDDVGANDCFTGTTNDVWFSFVASEPNVAITVSSVFGDDYLQLPSVALFEGGCSNLSVLNCVIEDTSLPEGFDFEVALSQEGLVVGNTYYIRVDGNNDLAGLFELCVSSNEELIQANSDCATASLVCSNDNQFIAEPASGEGEVLNELEGSGCSNFFTENQTSWVAWQAAADGTLSFTLNPIFESDDIDFILYELPDGYGNCDTKIALRCMASGDFSADSPCMGDTGLGNGATDTDEGAGCTGFDGWAAPLEMEAGKVYVLAINNFTTSNNGFELDFGPATPNFTTPNLNIAAPDQLICAGNALALEAALIFENDTATGVFDWEFGPNATPSTENTCCPNPIFFTAGYAIASFQTLTGCAISDTILVSVADSFIVALAVAPPNCTSGTLGSISVSVPAQIDNFTVVLNNTDTLQNGNEFSSLNAGSYTVVVENAQGCQETATVVLAVEDTIALQVEAVSPNCVSVTGSLTIVTPQNLDNLLVLLNGTDTLAAGSTFSGLVEGAYEITVSNAIGCTAAFETLLVVSDSFDLYATSTLPSCENNNLGSIEIVLPQGLENLTLTVNGNIVVPSEGGLIDSLAPGSYALLLGNEACEDTANFVLDLVPNDFSFEASPDTGIYVGSSVVLSAFTATEATFAWATTGPTIFEGENYTVMPDVTTTYLVTGMLGTCSYTDSITVFVEELYIKFPTAFSPNNDAINDKFQPVAEGVTLMRFDIYNRWGKRVHFDWTQPWDGTWNSEAQPSDVYTYVIEVLFPDGLKKVYKGDVTLIR